MEELEDRHFLSELKRGKQAALEKIYAKYYDKVCATIYTYVRQRQTTEDLAQELFVKLWSKRADLTITSLPAYLRKMAANESLMHLRKHNSNRIAVQEVEIASTVEADDALRSKEMQAKIAFAIKQLPPTCRQIFQMSRFKQMSYKEIAAELDISPKTVENQMGKALRLMRMYLK